MRSELIYWVWLTIAFGPANPRKWNLLSHYNSVKSAYEKIMSGDLSFVMPQDKDKVTSATLSQAEKLISYCEEKGINIYSFDDELYPDRLREIYNPPSVLFVLGDIAGLDNTVVISCVGTKTPSDYSVDVTYKICHDLAKAGVTIASGFTVGLDSIAHKAAIKAGGKTIAVLPCGVLHDYPKENSKAKQIIAQNGAVISEYFPGERVSTIYFRARNRILSGIGLGTLVTQAGAQSGALSTASFALSQGRDIFCIPPHELFNEAYAGAINLIRDGAISVFEAKDILNEYYSIYAHKLNPEADALKRRASSGLFSSNEIEEPKKPKAKKPAAKAESKVEEIPKQPQKRVTPESLDGIAIKIWEYLADNGAVLADELSDVLDIDISELEMLLTDLELDGHIRSLPGNRFSI
ncbi:MAG: DNA-processing protein DprA [Oscillospiraceae bacterium]|nr:DNA-processing protein DprA [Oscillospiraceae bacterium]